MDKPVVGVHSYVNGPSDDGLAMAFSWELSFRQIVTSGPAFNEKSFTTKTVTVSEFLHVADRSLVTM